MAVLGFHGFESGGADWFTTGDSGTFTREYIAGAARSGNYGLRIAATTSGYAYVMGAVSASTDLFVTFHFKVIALPTASEPICGFYSSGALKGELRLNSAGRLDWFNQTPVLVENGDFTLSLDQWYRIEVWMGTGLAARYMVNITQGTDPDAATTMELNGVANHSASTTNQVRFGKTANRNNKSCEFYFDDIIIDNAVFQRATKVLPMYPRADGTYGTWIAGAGDGDYRDYDDVGPHDSDTTYLKSSVTVGQAETCLLQSCATAGIVGEIVAVWCQFIHKRDGATNGQFEVRIRSGGSDYTTSSNYASTSSYAAANFLFLTDPVDSNPWTMAKLDALEIGMVEDRTTYRTRVTAMRAYVAVRPPIAIPYMGVFGIR